MADEPGSGSRTRRSRGVQPFRDAARRGARPRTPTRLRAPTSTCSSSRSAIWRARGRRPFPLRRHRHVARDPGRRAAHPRHRDGLAAARADDGGPQPPRRPPGLRRAGRRRRRRGRPRRGRHLARRLGDPDARDARRARAATGRSVVADSFAGFRARRRAQHPARRDRLPGDPARRGPRELRAVRARPRASSSSAASSRTPCTRCATARWAIVRLDGDTYTATQAALAELYPSLAVGGHLIVDDYGAFAECKQAVDDFRAAHGDHRAARAGRLDLRALAADERRRDRAAPRASRARPAARRPVPRASTAASPPSRST